ncbi:AAA family ATPase [Winogradskyella sp.]|uniref:AAA family ATPase n=1 Tax=Winogradskyella sp. TaxID=1883156 RepID=UPI001B15F256|nr:AAA family ATPase [Winogradskyella sp.]MBO6880827.1 AAA family ATPase [Winogradskyella sp.]
MKIKNITINKYKAFQRSEDIKVGGKNVFIYGENGSGKSSVYYALKDFFQSSVENIKMSDLRNLYLNDGQADCSIKVEFDNNTTNSLSESGRNTNIPSIIDANRLKSFVTYKHLLGVHNVKLDNELNIFDLVVKGVLKHYKSQTVTGGVELGKLWGDLLAESKIPYGSGKYYHATKKRKAVEEKAIIFNNALDSLFFTGGSDYLGPVVNKILDTLIPGLEINFLRHRINVNAKGEITVPKIALLITSDGMSLDTHYPHFSLNEAKLSAIAISIFLGAIVRQSSFSQDIKILFLDDILIGLDNEHRLKLLKLLKEPELQDFQTLITTYDRHWYEVAKLQLTDWKFLEFYKGSNGPAIIDNEKDDLKRAKDYFDAYDFPAAGNYLRKVLEKTLRDKLPKTYTHSEEKNGSLKPLKLDTLIDRLRLYYSDIEVEVPIQLIDSIKIYKSVLFNPMSHDDIKSPIYKNDIEDGFKVIDELQKLQLPIKDIVIEKNKTFQIDLPVISYKAEVVVVENVYKVNNNGTISFTASKFSFNLWTRETVNFAKSTGRPIEAYPPGARLDNILKGPYDLEWVTKAINPTYKEKGLAEINVEDLKSAMNCDGKTLTQWLA